LLADTEIVFPFATPINCAGCNGMRTDAKDIARVDDGIAFLKDDWISAID
jgi:hypothetical protein